jgi:MoaA/NifB/PqqE/SkfB family radical SAM enzyme
MNKREFLVGSPYYVERVMGLNEYERARNGLLTHLSLNQTPVCDCKCRRCFMPEYRRGTYNNSLATSDYKRILENAREIDIRCLEISGEGEPLLNPQIYEIIDSADSNEFITTLITNGHMLNRKAVKHLFNHNVTLVFSLFSLNRDRYEFDNGLPGSFDRTLNIIEYAASIYFNGIHETSFSKNYRMAIHTTAQGDNLEDISRIKEFCDDRGIFLSIAPLAPVGGGEDLVVQGLGLSLKESRQIAKYATNSIILSESSKEEIGREVCGTCLYGLNIGYDGNLLFDAHAGYEIQGILGNVRKSSIRKLVETQREVLPKMFQSIEGFCPVRDSKWPKFLSEFIARKDRVA